MDKSARNTVLVVSLQIQVLCTLQWWQQGKAQQEAGCSPVGLPRCWFLTAFVMGAAYATQETGKQGGRYGLSGLWKKSKQKLPSTAGVTLLGFKSVSNLACPREFCISMSPILPLPKPAIGMWRLKQVSVTCSSWPQHSIGVGRVGFLVHHTIPFVIVCV